MLPKFLPMSGLLILIVVLAPFILPTQDPDSSLTEPLTTPTETGTPTESPTPTEISPVILKVSALGGSDAAQYDCTWHPCRTLNKAANEAPSGVPVEIWVAGDPIYFQNNTFDEVKCNGNTSLFCVDAKEIKVRCGFHPTSWVQVTPWNWMPVYLDARESGRIAEVTNGGSLTIEQCRLTQGNVGATGYGGMFKVTDGTLVLTDLYADGGEAGWGGAIYAVNSHIEIQRASFNWVGAAESGGFIYAEDSTLLMVNMSVVGAGAAGEDSVAGWHLVGSTAEVLHSAIWSNRGVDNNNPPPSLGVQIGAFSSTVGVTNTIFALAEIGIQAVNSSVFGSHNDFWELGVANHQGTSLVNDFELEPMIGAMGELNPASPLRDLGVDTWVPEDIEGDPRGNPGDPPDIGPDELTVGPPTNTPTITSTTVPGPTTHTPTVSYTPSLTPTSTASATSIPTRTATLPPAVTLTPSSTPTGTMVETGGNVSYISYLPLLER